MLDNNGSFATEKGQFLIETKPHGHGDVHTLIHQHGVIQKWKQQGKRWIVFFQDTNSLIFRCIPSVLGVSFQKDFDVNSVTVPRRPGEAIGAICQLTSDKGEKLTINVEYNQLEPLLKAKYDPKGDVPNEKGFSPFPGNANVLAFKLAPYLDILDATKGLIPEFVNPKYADESKIVFKSATRLECMMQEFPKLMPSDANVGFTMFDRNMSQSAVKNNVVDGGIRYKKGLPPETASTGE